MVLFKGQGHDAFVPGHRIVNNANGVWSFLYIEKCENIRLKEPVSINEWE